MLRRNFLRAAIGGMLVVWSALRSQLSWADSRYAFLHGVASGDPRDDAILIWTRVSGALGERLSVDWQLASDPQMANILRRGHVRTSRNRDYTVKVDVDELPGGTQLYYRFSIEGVVSPIGRTRTLPTGSLKKASFAVVSCSNYPAGFFHAYREIAARDDIEAVIHLGDYLYEYGPGEYATEKAEALGRIPDPPNEAVSVDDYRRRHAQYKTDPDLQAMQARHPLISVWDDHEIVNDAWRGGGANHNDGEGHWPRRRDAAIRAYFEWMPIRGEPKGRHTRVFRTFRYGDLLSLIMLDTRLYGRDRQADADLEVSREAVVKALANRKRRMLGRRQENWLRKSLQRDADATWQVIGQQVMMSPVKAPNLEPIVDPERPSTISRELLDHNIAMSMDNPPLLLDTWDGYPAARADLLGDLEKYARNPIVLSGDLHTSIAGNLVPDGGSASVAVEFMAPSVSSPGFGEYLPERRPGALRDATLALNPALRYMETARRGWLCMTLTPLECTAEWHLLDTVHSREYSSTIDRRLVVYAGKLADGLQSV